MPLSACGSEAFYTYTWVYLYFTFCSDIIPKISIPPSPQIYTYRESSQGWQSPSNIYSALTREEGEKKGREETEKRVREFKSELRTRTFHPRLTKGLSTWESQGGGRDSVNFQHTFFQWTKLTCITGALSAHSASTGGVSAEQLACCKFTP